MAISNPNLLQTLIPLLSFSLMFLLASSNPNKLHSQDTTSFSFDSFDSKPKYLVYQGGAHVPSGSNALRLTPTDDDGSPVAEAVGRVLYSKPVHMWDRSSSKVSAFQTSLRFDITSSFFHDATNDGIAFFMAPVNTTIPEGSSGGNLGIFESSGTASQLFAVEFDTFPDIAYDPLYHHIGIDINSRESKNYTKFDSAAGEEVTVFINYQPNNNVITVAASSGSQYATLMYSCDLTKVLPEWVQVGLSSSTGILTQFGVSDIHSWYFTSTLVHMDNSNNKKKNRYIRQYVVE